MSGMCEEAKARSVGVYGGYEDWNGRAGRFRSLGDGQVDFSRIFSLLTSYGYDGWAILEWECCIKSPDQGAREGAPFIKNHIIEATETTDPNRFLIGVQWHPEKLAPENKLQAKLLDAFVAAAASKRSAATEGK